MNYLLVLKRYHTPTELTDVLKNFLRDHNGLFGLFVVSEDSVKFSGMPIQKM